MHLWLCPAFAFLLGSVPFGLLIAKARGVDIRAHGSGNIGATNVLRVVGKKYGILCLALDILKGFVPVVVALSLIWIDGKPSSLSLAFLRDWFGGVEPTPRPQAQLLHVVTGLCAILGHNFSPWLGFKGGKGIATSAGVVLGLYPFFGVCLVLVIWLGLFLATRYVSVASIGAAMALPLLTHLGARFHHVHNDKSLPTLWEAGQWNKPLFALSVAIAVMAVWKHRTNIRRLLAGTESRFQRKKNASP
ncbi:MAG: glycerol-3-phosphate 1-O-acyltransferase PlsY [Akkermansiaceae bacterium]|jgi:glycerol-3-phosphate acyltransferase PlsY|nr:glycerol-3-phosphate 1-O-acyltransferase PlsY [Akkermansiaceae bacterium]